MNTQQMNPRIYIYKITFVDAPYYYYGVHKEKVFNEAYWGSPVTNKRIWEWYQPKKQILQIFDYTEEGFKEAQEVEKRLIQPVYKNDKWCLNANCGGRIDTRCIRRALSTVWKCTVTGKICGVRAMNKHQRKYGIDFSNRIRHEVDWESIPVVVPKNRFVGYEMV